MERLRERRQYQAVGRGIRVARPGLILQAAPQSAAGALPRFGFTVTKKTGGAVERNRIRRRLKEAVRLAAKAASPGVDYVVIGRRAALDRSFDALLADLAAGFAKAGERPAIMKRMSATTEQADG
ncbi:MAG: ribonuclease P protein component [Bauldia sp.]